MNLENSYIQVKRGTITPQLREYVLKRDNYTCRYCGSKKEPFHLDHVYPVSKGGETSVQNLVTACRKCNSEKHATVGIYPKPIGYFENYKFFRFWLFMSNTVLGTLVSILFLMSLFETNSTVQIFEVIVGFICWFPIIKELITGNK